MNQKRASAKSTQNDTQAASNQVGKRRWAPVFVYISWKSVSYDPSIAPPPPSPTSTGTYQGCFHHSWSDFELVNVPVIDYSHASPKSCRGHCSAAGFVYYALEFGYMCSCGSRLPGVSKVATSANCSLVRREKEDDALWYACWLEAFR